MSLGRVLILLGILSGLTLLVGQNLSPAIALVFLGNRSRVLPLSVWVLGAIFCGIIFACLIQVLFQWSNYLYRQELKVFTRRRSFDKQSSDSQDSEILPESETPSYSPTYRQTKFSPWTQLQNETDAEPRPNTARDKQSSANTAEVNYKVDRTRNADENWGDWMEAPPRPDPEADWDELGKKPSPGTKHKVPAHPNLSKDETPSDAKKASKSDDTSYSFGVKDPKGSGVGQTESVYDADFRVIIPPYKPVPDRSDDHDQDDGDGI